MTDFMEISRNITSLVKYEPDRFEVRDFVYINSSQAVPDKHYAYIEIGGRKVEIGTGITSFGQKVSIESKKYTSLVHRDLDEDIDYLNGEQLYQSIKKSIDELLEEDHNIEALVISTAGTVKDGNLVSSFNLKKFLHIRFTERVREDYPKLRVKVYNDAEALIWGSLYFNQDKGQSQHLIDIIVGTGFNILYSKSEYGKVRVYDILADFIKVADDMVIEDVIAGKFVDKNRHKYFPEFLYYVSAGNTKAVADELVRVLNLPKDDITVVFQGGIIENAPIYAEKFERDYPNVINAKDLSHGKNINAYGAIYHDLFELDQSL